MSSISKFGFSQNDNNNNTAGTIGPRGATGATGATGQTGQTGQPGQPGQPGQDAKFPLNLNYGDIVGIASLSGGAGSSIYINSNVDMNGYNSFYNVSSINGYDAIGQHLAINSPLVCSGTVQIFQDFERQCNNLLD